MPGLVLVATAAHSIVKSGTPAPTQRQLQVVRFGQDEHVVVAAEDVLTFPHGLVGMEHLQEFALLEDTRILPCRWLQSLEDPAVAFVVVPPQMIVPEYGAEVSDLDARLLRLHETAETEVWAIVSIGEVAEQSTVNLLAPVVVNRQHRLGKQLLLDGSGYAIRHPLIAGATPSASGGE